MLHGPDTAEYAAATSPVNTTATQRPALVARPGSAAEVADVVVEAGRRGLTVLPQGTGHGAAGDVGPDTLVLDTTGLTGLDIDPAARTCAAGAGLTWGAVNAEAETHGLLGLAGSSPGVGIAGYTFGGGIGWLTRPHGLASSALRRVEYVDGRGAVRVAAEDAADAVDREALWAFRGGGGVGVATRLEFDLVPAGDLHAGYLLWPFEALDAVAAAWTAAATEVSTSIGVLQLPPVDRFPAELRGRPAVHVALAAGSATPGLLAALRAAAPPAADTWGPADAATLARIHLDPPGAVPALGDARWLTAGTATAAALAVVPESALVMAEVRSVGTDAPARDGALTRPLGPYVVHVVGPLTGPAARTGIDRAAAEVRAAVAGVDAGFAVGSWVEGRPSAPDALPPDVRARVAATADAVDPDHHLHRTRHLG